MADNISAFPAEFKGSFRYDLENRHVWLSTSVPSYGFLQIIRQEASFYWLVSQSGLFQ